MHFLFSFSLIGQELSIKGGFSFADIVISETDDEAIINPRSTFHGGVLVNFPFSNLLSFETGVMYQNRGYKSEDSGEFLGVEFSSETDVRITYIDIPLTLRATFEVGELSIYAYGGGYAGIGISGEGESKNTTAGMTTTITEDIEFGEEGQFKRIDYGALIGVGVEFGSIFIDAGYNIGLANVLDTGSDDKDVNNRLLTLSLGYRIN